jgi:hypothetical protein
MPCPDSTGADRLDTPPQTSRPAVLVLTDERDHLVWGPVQLGREESRRRLENLIGSLNLDIQV